MAQACARSSLYLRSNPVPSTALRRADIKHRRPLARAAHSSQDNLFFVAQNNFKVKKEGCAQFEEIWKNRESHLKDTPGFIRFALLRGDEEGVYISESHWQSRQAFQDWTQGANFAKAHGQSQSQAEQQQSKPKEGSKRGGMADLLEGPPKPKMFQAVTVTQL